MARNNSFLDQTSDSFLDILSNVVAVLILIAILVVISSSEISIHMDTPVLHEPPPNSMRTMFECQGNQLTAIDEVSVINQAYGVFESYIKQVTGEVSPEALQDFYNNALIDTRNYFVSVKVVEMNDTAFSIAGTYTRKASSESETIQQASNPGSHFYSKLTSLNKQHHYFYFFVREDCFETYRAARDLVRSHGFEAGWYPLHSSSPLGFSLGNGTNNGVGFMVQ